MNKTITIIYFIRAVIQTKESDAIVFYKLLKRRFRRDATIFSSTTKIVSIIKKRIDEADYEMVS